MRVFPRYHPPMYVTEHIGLDCSRPALDKARDERLSLDAAVVAFNERNRGARVNDSGPRLVKRAIVHGWTVVEG